MSIQRDSVPRNPSLLGVWAGILDHTTHTRVVRWDVLVLLVAKSWVGGRGRRLCVDKNRTSISGDEEGGLDGFMELW